MSTLVDFQQQRKRSKVYPQLNFLLLRKIALEVGPGICLCVCALRVRVGVRAHMCTERNDLEYEFTKNTTFLLKRYTML